MLVFMFLFPIIFLGMCLGNSLGVCSTPKLSKLVISLFNVYNAINEFQHLRIHQDLLHMSPFFMFLGKLSLE